MASIFTRIINGEIPSYKVAEDENFLAFLDINPLEKGHTLVVPKKEIDYIFDLDDETLQGMIVFAKRVAKKIQAKIACKRVAVVVFGLEVIMDRFLQVGRGHSCPVREIEYLNAQVFQIIILAIPIVSHDKSVEDRKSVV